MVKLYLITGFLGAGKTTLLKNLIKQLSGVRLKIIVNEFGREGIDGALLRETGAEVEEINSGSIFCSCRLDKFEEMLKKVIAQSPELILKWSGSTGCRRGPGDRRSKKHRKRNV